MRDKHQEKRLAAVAGSLILGALLCAPAFVARAQQSALAQDVTNPFHEGVLAEVAQGSELKEVCFGDKHVAWIENQGGKRVVKLDGKPQGGVYDEVKHMNFNEDEAHFGFFAKRNSEWVFVLDGQEHSPGYTKTTEADFQPNGNSIAYGVCHEKKCRLVVDGTDAGAEYEDISYPLYSHDGKRLAYIGKRGKKWIAVVDGKEMGTELDEVWFSAWGFSHDGSRFHVAGRIKSKWMHVVDGVPGPGFEVISPIAFSHDGRHYAYGGTDATGGFKKQKTFGMMTVDGQSTGTYEGRGMAGTWTALGGSHEVMSVGVREFIPDFHGISTPQFNSESKLVFAARRDKGDVAVFVGGEPGPGFDEILSPVAFSADSKHSAYVGKRGEDFVEVRDNQAGQTFNAGKRGPTDVHWIAISLDGAHLAYEIVSGGAQFKAGNTRRALRSVVIDGKAGTEYDALGLTNFDFAGDERHYFYQVIGAKGGRDLVNVDGHESRLYDAVANAHYVEGGKTVRFLARDGGRLLGVTYALSSVSNPTTAINQISLPLGGLGH